MRKIFLSLAVLTIAVAANAFELRMQNSDLGVNKSITTAADDPDFFGDGKVQVTFDAENKVIDVYFDNATLKGTNANELFYFMADANYTNVMLHLKGANQMIGAGDYSKPIYVAGTPDGKVRGTLGIVAEDPATAALEISSKTMVIQLNYNASMAVGATLTGDAFYFIIKTTSASQPVFYGGGGESTTQLLWFMTANLDITATENNQVTKDLESFAIAAAIRTEGVTIEGANLVKDGAPYKGSLKAVYPYPIKVGDTWMYPDVPFAPAELKSGTINYNSVAREVALDNVEIDGALTIYNDNAYIALKGNNKFTNTTNKSYERIGFVGTHCGIFGDKDATLSINGNDLTDGIYASDGLEIKGFKKLTIEAVKKGIEGSSSTKETDVLKLYSVPMEIKAADGAIVDFENLLMGATDVEWSPAASYNATKKALVDVDDNILNEVALTKKAALEQILNGKTVNGKFIHNGQLFIERNGEIFNATGARVK